MIDDRIGVRWKPTSSRIETHAAGTPGRRTLTEDLNTAEGTHDPLRGSPPDEARLPRLDIGAHTASVSSAMHTAPPRRVADAADQEPNAVIKVVAYAKGEILGTPWGAKARWEGPLPQKYTGTKGPNGWTWDSPDAKTVRIGSDLRGRGGRTAEAWAGLAADTIVIYASALDAVANDKDAEPDAHAPGHEKGSEGEGGGGDHHGDTGDLDAKLADDFERQLGLDPGTRDDDDDDAPASAVSGGAVPGRGRTGPDTRAGGTGPGGEHARPDGDREGSADGGRGGSADGSRDGAKGGADDGMYGGEGQPGDGGVPSAVALFGGLVSLPAALRGFIELALIVSAGDVTGAGAQLFKKGLGKIASAAAARKMIAHEARLAVVKETKAALQRIAADKRTAAARLLGAAAQVLPRLFRGRQASEGGSEGRAAESIDVRERQAKPPSSRDGRRGRARAADRRPAAAKPRVCGEAVPQRSATPGISPEGPAVHRSRLSGLLAIRPDATQRPEVSSDQVYREPQDRLRGGECEGRIRENTRRIHLASS